MNKLTLGVHLGAGGYEGFHLLFGSEVSVAGNVLNLFDNTTRLTKDKNGHWSSLRNVEASERKKIYENDQCPLWMTETFDVDLGDLSEIEFIIELRKLSHKYGLNFNIRFNNSVYFIVSGLVVSSSETDTNPEDNSELVRVDKPTFIPSKTYVIKRKLINPPSFASNENKVTYRFTNKLAAEDCLNRINSFTSEDNLYFMEEQGANDYLFMFVDQGNYGEEYRTLMSAPSHFNTQDIANVINDRETLNVLNGWDEFDEQPDVIHNLESFGITEIGYYDQVL